MKNIHLYGQFLRLAILGKVQYKADFLVGIVSILLLNTVNLSLIGILVYNFHTLGDWGIWDLLFLYSFWMLSRGICNKKSVAGTDYLLWSGVYFSVDVPGFFIISVFKSL